MAAGLNWTHKQQEGIDLLYLEGRLDTVSSPRLDQQIKQLLEEGTTRLILLLSDLEYLSSAGMRTLLSTAKQLKGIGGGLVIAAPTNAVLDLIKMAGFDTILTICSSEEAALQALQG